MKKDIEKTIIQNVEVSLAEIDIDGMLSDMTSKKKVKEIVEQMVKDKIARTFEEKVLLQYRKRERIIDAWAYNKLNSLLIELGVK